MGEELIMAQKLDHLQAGATTPLLTQGTLYYPVDFKLPIDAVPEASKDLVGTYSGVSYTQWLELYSTRALAIFYKGKEN